VSFAEEKATKKQRVSLTSGPSSLERSLEGGDPVSIWCRSINQDSNNEDARAYMQNVLERSESRTSRQAEELLGESPPLPSSNLPSTLPRERVFEEPHALEEEPPMEVDCCIGNPLMEVDCCVGAGSEEPVCCISQGMSLLTVF
jgi:hypothetical protein